MPFAAILRLFLLCTLFTASAQAADERFDPRVFDAEFYHQRYHDLRAAFRGDEDKLKAHWAAALSNSKPRIAHPDFSPRHYLARYPDLQKAFKDDYAAATRHYINVGIREGRNGQWQPTKSWSSLPATSGDITIEAGKRVVIDQDIDAGGITVRGTLECGDRDLKLRVKWILVYGRFECGTAREPFNRQLIITLRAPDTDNVQIDDTHMVDGMPMVMKEDLGTKFIVVMEKGVLSLHGRPAKSWKHLARTAAAGASTVDVVDQGPGISWRVGDRIVITETRPARDWKSPNTENEVRTIAAISDPGSGKGKRITLDQPLKFPHFGQIQTFPGVTKKDPDIEVDTRAEVALLSRNITLEAETSASNPRFGGYIMAMHGGQAFVANVRLSQMGQEGLLGRYPFHWHMAGDVGSVGVGQQYFNNNVIENAFHRCVTVHGTHNAVVRGNVCFNHLGHGFFLEDGVETGNLFERNLAILTRRPSKPVRDDDVVRGLASIGPAAFYISNGNNRFINNVSVSSEGLAFWYHTREKPVGE
ncbi:MAG: hypothetical protein RIR70_753 [Pseudomonadota bacterium]